MTPNDFSARSPLNRDKNKLYRQGTKRCHCDIETGHRSTSATIIGNIAHKTKQYLEWDAKAEQFTNQPSANKFLSYAYRAPYKLPT